MRLRGTTFHTGDYWYFAVRPINPTQVYPHRYAKDFQPPEGPREWLCPLAVVVQAGDERTVEDCREPFDNLVELTRRRGAGCCTVTISPDDLGRATLQEIINKATRLRAERVTVCLQPGEYSLDEPLRLTRRHSNLTIEACEGGAVLSVTEERENAFLQGMIQIVQAANIHLCGLIFDLPLVGYAQTGMSVSGWHKVASVRVRPSYCAACA